jgi:hypothetical protein
MRSAAAAALILLLSAAARADDTAAPVIDHTPVASAPRGAKFVQVFATITDESRFFPQVFYRYGPGEYQKPLDMKAVKGMKSQFGANIPVKGDLVEYYVEAYDELGNGPGRSGDPDKPWRVDTSGMGPLMAQPAPAPAPKAWTPPPAPAPVVLAAPPPPPRPVVVQQSGRTWTWLVGGVGVGALAGGLIAGQSFKTADDAYQKSLAAPGADYAALKAQYDANKSLGSTATILMAAGGAFIVGAVVLFFVEGGSSGGSGSGGDGALHF